MQFYQRLTHHFLLSASVFLSLGLYSSRGHAQSIGTDITSLTINTTADSTQTVNKVNGNSEFAGKTYKLRFLGLTQSITGFFYGQETATLEQAVERKVAASEMFNISRNTLDLWLNCEARTGGCEAVTNYQQGSRANGSS